MLIILPILFTIDYCAYVLLDAPIILSLTTCFFYLLSGQQNYVIHLMACFILIGLQSLLFYNIPHLALISLTPIALLGNYMHQFFLKTACINIILIMGYILCNNLLAAFLLKQPTPMQNYTIWQLCSTLGIVFGMSLIIRVAGTTDNRL